MVLSKRCRMLRRFFPLVLLLPTAVCLIGCGGEPLDYETALNLMRERTSEPVKTSFSATPHAENQDFEVSRAYARLEDAHVLVCKSNSAVGRICEPGPAGDGLTQNGVTDITLVAGRWVPASIVAMQRTGRSSASA